MELDKFLEAQKLYRSIQKINDEIELIKGSYSIKFLGIDGESGFFLKLDIYHYDILVRAKRGLIKFLEKEKVKLETQISEL